MGGWRSILDASGLWVTSLAPAVADPGLTQGVILGGALSQETVSVVLTQGTIAGAATVEGRGVAIALTRGRI